MPHVPSRVLTCRIAEGTLDVDRETGKFRVRGNTPLQGVGPEGSRESWPLSLFWLSR